MNSLEQVIRPSILKAITHKSEEKRKLGRTELERIIFVEADRSSQQIIYNIVTMFHQQYLKSSDINKRIIGLEVMVTILSRVQYNSAHLKKVQTILINNILSCLIDSEAKIRALTFSKIFELTQLFKDDSMRFFNLIFQKMIGCINDTQQSVKNSCQFVDKKVLKNLFSKNYNNSEYDIVEFINIIKSKIKTLNLQVRRYLIGWIQLMLQQGLIVYLGQFLQDLLMMISDKQIQSYVNECLNCFKYTIKQKFDDNSLEMEVSSGFINELFSILIKVANSKCLIYTKLQALQWFKIFFVFFRQQVEVKAPRPNQKFHFKKIVIQRFDQILEPILLLMSHQQEEVRRQSIFVNEILMDSIQKVDKSQPINIVKIVPLLKEALSQKKASNTSQHAINWMKFMFENYEGLIIPGMKEIVEKVMQKIYEGNAKNIYEIIEIMKSKEDYFQLMIQKILLFLNKKIHQQEDKMELMLKKFINPKDITLFWFTICKHIDKYEHQSLFMYEIAASLSSIIINELNLLPIRQFLTKWAAPNYKLHFLRMFKILKYNPSSVISLCFLAHQYELAYRIIKTLTGKHEISSKMLIGLCRLVSQIECPAFVALRMKILEQKDYYLLQSLNSLLMILPQGKIFNMLRNRLDSGGLISIQNKIQSNEQPNINNPLNINELFEQYKNVFGLK